MNRFTPNSLPYEIFTTALMAVYFLSFALVDSRLAHPAFTAALTSLLFFPIYLAVTWVLRLKALKENLFLPLDIALAVAAVTNVVSIGSPAFFSVMFIAQVLILGIGFLWSAYEFSKSGRGFQFFLSFTFWFLILLGVGILVD